MGDVSGAQEECCVLSVKTAKATLLCALRGPGGCENGQRVIDDVARE